MEIEIRYLSDKIEPLRYIDGKSDWIDLRAAADIEMKAGEFRLIPLGIAVRLPEGYEAYVVSRSSLYRNYGIIQANSFGIVDETYCGDNDEWFFPAIALRDTIVHTNDRICQFRIQKHQPPVEFVVREHLSDTDRGGFGTTGLN
ncbi:MAG: deoxyuridine 5'-triphosphate nucleotidohydrolase [Lachnospiraceae bacterium]|nr:deoxyuridine 5'-triphosphate nucleotidohydrolase [Lachnospiraceae bacterium]